MDLSISRIGQTKSMIQLHISIQVCCFDPSKSGLYLTSTERWFLASWSSKQKAEDQAVDQGGTKTLWNTTTIRSTLVHSTPLRIVSERYGWKATVSSLIFKAVWLTLDSLAKASFLQSKLFYPEVSDITPLILWLLFKETPQASVAYSGKPTQAM